MAEREGVRPADREFLFTYRFDGADWGISVFASSSAEAKEKIKAVAWARYDGELMMRIPASIPGSGLFTRMFTWWKNSFPPRSGGASND